jgi:hypothetical protein
MNTIFSTDDLPKRRLYLKQTLANRNANDAGREISIMREQITKQIAQKCVENGELVSIVASDMFVAVVADCIILTTDELDALMRKQFRAGIDHARNFMPSYG